MAEYIEREALLNRLETLVKRITPIEENRDVFFHDSGVDAAITWAQLEVKKAPAADVVEVVYAKWIRYHYADFGWDEWGFRCSNCEWEVEDRDITFPMNFCPLCGAKMGEERRSE